MNVHRQIGYLGIILLSIGAGCATSKPLKREYSPEELYKSACSSGQEIHSVQGNVSLKVSSPQITGRFPAMVKVTSHGQLALEVMNPFGGTEATVLIEGDHYKVKRPGKKKNSETEGAGTWSGIPLAWVSDLFLGKIPCPSAATLNEIPDLKIKQEVDQLTLLIAGKDAPDAQEFHFHFQDKGGKPWADSLKWIRGNSLNPAINFKFDDPEKLTDIPLKWEAKSEQGTIQVRWRERNANTARGL